MGILFGSTVSPHNKEYKPRDLLIAQEHESSGEDCLHQLGLHALVEPSLALGPRGGGAKYIQQLTTVNSNSTATQSTGMTQPAHTIIKTS